MRESERGDGLLEAIIASAIAAICLAAVVTGTVAAAHRYGGNAVEAALHDLAQRESRVAVDLLKYEGGSIVPVTVATSAPLPGGTGLPVHASVSTAALAAGGFTIIVHVEADGRSETATVTTTVPAPVPIPSSEVTSPVEGAAPI